MAMGKLDLAPEPEAILPTTIVISEEISTEGISEEISTEGISERVSIDISAGASEEISTEGISDEVSQDEFVTLSETNVNTQQRESLEAWGVASILLG